MLRLNWAHSLNNWSLIDWPLIKFWNRYTALSGAVDAAFSLAELIWAWTCVFGTTCRTHTVSGAAGWVQVGQTTERDCSDEDPKEKPRRVFSFWILYGFRWVEAIHSAKLADSGVT